MQREALLAGGAAAVLGVLVVAAAVVPGITASPAEDRLRPSALDVRETSLAAGNVGGQTATLQVTTWLEHRGGTARSVEVYYRAVDADTGLVVATATRSLGNLSTDGEVTSRANLTVERAGDYRLETVVYEDGRRIDRARTTVRGVGSLEPAYARSPVRFHEFGGTAAIPPIEYSVVRVADGRATVNISAYLTNEGDAAIEGLRVTLVARQADSNIVADRASVPIGDIRAGRTATPSATLSMPDNYSYYLDAVLWADGIVVASARAPANLDPSRSVPANETRTSVDLDSDEFAAETSTAAEGTPHGRESGTPAAADQPGFGLAAGLVALLGAALFARRWST